MRYIWPEVPSLLVLMFIATIVVAQDKPLAEITGAYQFNHLSASVGGQSESDNFPAGFDASLNVPITPWFGAVGDIGYVRKTYTAVADSLSASASASVWTFGGGPQLTYRNPRVQPFVRLILGEAHSSVFASLDGSLSGVSGGASTNSFFIAPGAGVDFKIAQSLWLRGGADYIRTSKDGVTLNGVRAFAGITFRFGGRGQGSGQDQRPSRPRTTPQEPQPLPTAPGPMPHPTGSDASGANVKIDALGITVTRGRNNGGEITDEVPNGAAALAGLRPGDVINSVDGKAVKTPMELEAELSNRPAGTEVRLGYLINGSWQTETVVLIRK
jgi:opacity protein-like surface antigen